jgi:ABC-type multidrug transport system fused ATPase/permease subunit
LSLESGEKGGTPSTWSRVGGFLKPYRGGIVALVSLTAALSILAMLPPLFTRSILNDVIGRGDRSLLPMLGVAILAVPVLYACIAFFQVMGIAILGQRFVLDVRMGVWRHLMRLHMGFYGSHSTGALLNRIMGDSTTMQQVLNVTSIQVVSDLVCSLFAVFATLWINWRLALPIFAIVALFVLNFRLSIGRIITYSRRYRATSDRLASGVQNRLVAALTVKTYAAEEREGAAFSGLSNTTTGQAHEAWDASLGFRTNIQLLQSLGHAAIYFLGCAMVLGGTADYGDVTAFTAYAMQILWPAVRFSNLAEQLQNVDISAGRLFEILDETPQVVDRPGARPIGKSAGRIDFDAVSFAYEEGRPVIRSFDLHVSPGETIALVGPTGCGKSTVLSLLMRLYDVDGGAIRLDGVDLRDIRLASLRRQFGIVLQESYLFTVDIADNIRYARPSASQEEVEAAARVAEIHDEILRLPRGYASVIGDRDVQLSVGQKQRIAIARAILADPSILIMDEATSALDSRSELAIQRAMDRFLVDRTSFIVAHRLSTIRNADRIVLLDKGEIVECGTHGELMAIEGGRYRDLYEKHSGKGVIADEREE